MERRVATDLIVMGNLRRAENGRGPFFFFFLMSGIGVFTFFPLLDSTSLSERRVKIRFGAVSSVRQ